MYKVETCHPGRSTRVSRLVLMRQATRCEHGEQRTDNHHQIPRGMCRVW